MTFLNSVRPERKQDFLCSMRKEGTERFAEQLDADIDGRVSAVEISTKQVHAESDASGILIGIVPTNTLILPVKLGGIS